MKTLYIIPARGGSKGIPGKNIKPLAGKPLIAYSVEVAQQLAPDCDICVTTDDLEIIATVENMGIKVPFVRPAELATDHSGTYEVLLHALNHYEQQGISYDRIVLLQPTSPFRTVDDVNNCLKLYTPDIDMVVSVKQASANPYYNAFETDENGFLHISKGEGNYTRRQDAPPVWEYNGAVYVINTQSLRKMPLNKFPRRRMCEMSAEHSIDLDTPTDWLIAESILKSRE
ncbi:MAG: acylneuraminate cytidylyltransferase family protein [Muribaculaceae bacterium]|jgi:N-acylneuraminate cytidylyltransferase|nr:acylneuraminate cytidylyltransferase family protein [Muribaculaceae bacterium]